MATESKEFSISWGALWRILAMLAMVSVLFLARDILIAVFLAIIISSAIDPLVSFLEKKRIPRILGTLAIYIIGVFAVALVIYILLPVFLVQLNGFFSNSGDILSSLFNSFGDASTQVLDTLRQGLSDLTTGFLGGKITLLSILSKFLGGVLFSIVVFVTSFYLTIDRDGVEKFLVTILPYGYQARVLDIYHRVRVKISSWFGAQLILSAVIAVSVWIGLGILGVNYSLILGITAGLFELVPYVGPIFSGSVAVLFAITQSFTLGIYTLVLFILIQQLESHILIPMIMSRSTNLNPVIVLVSILIGAEVFGAIGAILSVPVAVLFQEILKHWSSTQPRSVGTPGINT